MSPLALRYMQFDLSEMRGRAIRLQILLDEATEAGDGHSAVVWEAMLRATNENIEALADILRHVQ